MVEIITTMKQLQDIERRANDRLKEERRKIEEEMRNFGAISSLH